MQRYCKQSLKSSNIPEIRIQQWLTIIIFQMRQSINNQNNLFYFASSLYFKSYISYVQIFLSFFSSIVLGILLQISHACQSSFSFCFNSPKYLSFPLSDALFLDELDHSSHHPPQLCHLVYFSHLDPPPSWSSRQFTWGSFFPLSP